VLRLSLLFATLAVTNYDVAIDYLTELDKGDLITPEFRKTLPFEKAEILIGSTSRLRDLGVIEERLDEAQKLLTDYASKNQSLEVSARTLRFQGNLLFQRSSIYLKQTKSDRVTDGEKEELRGKARELLEGSLASYKKARAQIKRLVDPTSKEAVRVDPEEPSTGKKLKQLQGSYVQVRVRLPQVAEQLADTYPPGDPQGKKLLEEAAQTYKKVYESYRRFHAGLKSSVYSARCEQKLGNHQEALEQLADIFELSNHSLLKPMKLEAYSLAAESWSNLKPYPYREVVKTLEPAVKVLNRAELRSPEWLRVQLELAVAQHASAVEIKKKGGPGASKESGELERAAAKILRNVVRVANPSRDRAKQLLSEWNISIATPKDPAEKAPQSFGDARQKAKDLLPELEVASNEANALSRKLKSEKDPAKKAELRIEFQDATVALREQAGGVLSYLDLALELANEETVRADVVNVRYLQGFCYFASRQYFESALIGEYLLAKYPTVPATQQSMTLLIQSYSSMLDLAKPGDKEFESVRLVNACNSVIDRWSGSSQAGIAASTMARLSIVNKDFAAAEQYLLKIPKDSPYRSTIGISVGRQMWVDVKSKISAGEDPASYKDQIVNSKQYLAQGVAGSPVDSLDYQTALGALVLVDAYVVTGEVDKAVKQLESAAIAPLDLVKQKHPAITNTPLAGLYSRETYRSAVKTYLAAMKVSKDKQKWVNKASGVIACDRRDATGLRGQQRPQGPSSYYGHLSADCQGTQK